MESVRLEGKTVLITGANTGIGKETAKEIARRGARVILACRDQHKAEAAKQEIVTETGNDAIIVKILDLGSLESVRRFAEDYNATESRLDILVNNAGVYSKVRRETSDGFELMFGVNHLGHFYLTNLLLDKLKTSAPSRIVILASKGHQISGLDFNNLQSTRGYSSLKMYGRTKTANVLFGVHLAKLLEGTGVTVYSLHPGVVTTEIARDYDEKGFMMTCFKFYLCMTCARFLTAVEGAQTTLYCCLEPSIAEHSGRYYSEVMEKTAKHHATNPKFAQQLWDVSLRLCGMSESEERAPTAVAAAPDA